MELKSRNTLLRYNYNYNYCFKNYMSSYRGDSNVTGLVKNCQKSVTYYLDELIIKLLKKEKQADINESVKRKLEGNNTMLSNVLAPKILYMILVLMARNNY